MMLLRGRERVLRILARSRIARYTVEQDLRGLATNMNLQLWRRAAWARDELSDPPPGNVTVC